MKQATTVLLGWFAAGMVLAGDLPLDADTPNYFEHFDPTQKPWHPGPGLNIEEVFKNYQYYEIRLDKNKGEIEVTHFIRNGRAGSQRYRIAPDGALEKLSR